jgi:host factor-I protein
MVDSPNNIQDEFFNRLRRERTPVILHLMNGFKIKGRIKGFDKFALVIEANGQEQIVFKHAISTVSSPKTFRNKMNLEPLLEEKNKEGKADRDKQVERKKGKGS